MTFFDYLRELMKKIKKKKLFFVLFSSISFFMIILKVIKFYL